MRLSGARNHARTFKATERGRAVTRRTSQGIRQTADLGVGTVTVHVHDLRYN